ncbi:MAG TPA: hypothetical protein VFM56_10605 [Solimonas sp.]|nr:hypothetical protein [Solimonas sp.]
MAQRYRDYRMSLAAGIGFTITAPGDYFQVLKSSAEVKLQFDDDVPIARSQGQGGPASYSRVIVSSATDQATVVIALGYTDGRTPIDSRATFDGTVNVSTDLPTVQQPIEDVTIAAGASASLAAVDATRTALVIRMPDDATGDIRVGDSSVAANKGLRLGAGDAASISGGAAIYAYNTSADPVTVSLLAERAP